MKVLLSFILLFFSTASFAQKARDYGVEIGVMKTGKLNSITDVDGVKVGHTTRVEGTTIRTGVTAILPTQEISFNKKYQQPSI